METTVIAVEGSWSRLALLIEQLLITSPGRGIATVGLTTVLMAGIVILTVWAVTKIIQQTRAKHNITIQTGIDQSAYADAIVSLVQDISRFNAWRDTVSRQNERIQEIIIIRDQMNMADAILGSIRTDLLLVMSDRLRERFPELDNAQDSPAYDSFLRAVDASINEIRVTIRRICKENHLAERNEHEYEMYVQEKIDQLRDLGFRVFETHYYSTIIPFQEMKDDYPSRWEAVAPRYRKLFKNLRSIAINYNLIMREKEQEYQTEWGAFLSKIPTRLARAAASPSQGG